MTSDIILYKADTVPVGEDQVPHLELAREIARRFNHLYGQTFPEPQARLTEYPVIVGLDGDHKMSKSLDNHIELASTPEETGARVATAFTDPQRHRLSDPGRPWVCNVYSLHKFFNPDRLEEVYQKCTAAEMGCVEDKRLLAEGINRTLEPLRERPAGAGGQAGVRRRGSPGWRAPRPGHRQGDPWRGPRENGNPGGGALSIHSQSNLPVSQSGADALQVALRGGGGGRRPAA